MDASRRGGPLPQASERSPLTPGDGAAVRVLDGFVLTGVWRRWQVVELGMGRRWREPGMAEGAGKGRTLLSWCGSLAGRQAP